MKFLLKTFLMISFLISFLSSCSSKENPAPFIPFNEWVFDAGISENGEILHVSKKFYYLTGNLAKNPPALINKPDWKFVFAFSKNFDQIAYKSDDEKLKIYSGEKTVTLSKAPALHENSRPIQASFSPDGKHLAIIFQVIKEGDSAYVFSTETGVLEHQIPEARNFENFKIGYGSLVQLFYTEEGRLVLKAKDYEDERYLVYTSDGSTLFSVIVPPEIVPGVEANFLMKAKSPKENLAAFERTLVGTKHYKYSSKLDKKSGPFVVEFKTGKTVFDEKTLPGWKYFLFLNDKILVLQNGAHLFCFYDLEKQKILSTFEMPEGYPRFLGSNRDGNFLIRTPDKIVLRDTQKMIFEKTIDSVFWAELKSGDFVLSRQTGLDVISKKNGENLFSIPYSLPPDTKHYEGRLTVLDDKFIVLTTKKTLVVFNLESKKVALEKPIPSYHSQVMALDSNHFLTTKNFKPGIADFRALVASPKDTLLLWEIPNP